MTFDLAQMIADREAGTPGEWFINGPTWNQIVWTDNETRLCFMTHSNGLNDARDEANARRIASVPLFEAEIIRLTARVERLTTGLEFYADESKYEKRRNPITYCTQEAAEIGPEGDCGDTARAALSTDTEEPKT